MDIFKEENDYKKYLSLLKEATTQFPCRVYNFGLLSHLIQLLIEPEQEGALSKAMEMATREYAKYFNQKYDSIGHVFAGRFKSFAIQPEQFFLATSRYIDLSPTRHDLVKEVKDYKWFGYDQLAYGNRDQFVCDQHDVYKSLGVTDQERQLVYRSLVHQYLGQELDLENRKSGILGSKEFKVSIKQGGNGKKKDL